MMKTVVVNKEVKNRLQRAESSDSRLYEQVSERILQLIEGGTLRPGQRVPSVRELSTQQSVSVSTVLQAYRQLENSGWIEARRSRAITCDRRSERCRRSRNRPSRRLRPPKFRSVIW
jgi:DNA-binding transcriptional regulator YhcF (GntR family)